MNSNHYIDTYYKDENGNCWDVTKYGLFMAKKLSETLVDCHNCINCSYCNNCDDCRYCEDCKDCTQCHNCKGCSDCSYCLFCKNCKSCKDCRDCINCIECSNLTYGKNCKNKECGRTDYKVREKKDE